LTAAPLRNRVRIELQAPVAEVWALVGSLERYPEYSAGLERVDVTRGGNGRCINRHVGKLVDLYPSDPWQAALCDEVMDAVEDVGHRIVATFDLPDAEKKYAVRRWWTASLGCT
jgi:hypothetical protein